MHQEEWWKRGYGSVAVRDRGEGTHWPLSPSGREGERFVFKCGLEVGGERWTEFAHHRARMTEKCV